MDLTGICLTLGTSLLLTLSVELSFAFLLGVRGRAAILLVTLANLATNPVVVYTYIVVRMFVSKGQADRLMPLLETGAIVLESWLYANTSGMMDPDRLFYGMFSAGREGTGEERKQPVFRAGMAALLLSVLLNAASFLAGTLVNSL